MAPVSPIERPRGGGRGESAPEGTGRSPGDALQVRDLHVRFASAHGEVHAVRGVDLTVRRGRTLGLVGRSGSGKSALGLAIMGLLPAGARASGSVRVGGLDLLGRSDAELSRHRGRELAMVFQDTGSALTPVLRVGAQVAEAVRVHGGSRRAAAARTTELLRLVGLDDPRRIGEAYPHELSGGQRQRIAIAIALANEPGLVIADEPTTALDVTVQAQVLDVLAAATRQTGAALLLITHDLGVVAGLADEVAVLERGEIVETAVVDELFRRPAHPVTRRLLAATPRLDAPTHSPAHLAPPPPASPRLEPPPDAPPLLQVRDASVRYRSRRAGRLGGGRGAPPVGPPATAAWWSRTAGRAPRQTPRPAVDGVDLHVDAGECLCVVGESGSGKSSLLRLVMDCLTGARTLDATVTGSVTAHRPGATVVGPPAQLVFQDSSGALDPRLSVGDTLAQALAIAAGRAAGARSRSGQDPGRGVRSGPAPGELSEQRRRLLRLVDLPPEVLGRYPWQLSGGQRQRVGIARALAGDPALLLLDEPVSALDVLVRADILALLARLRQELGIAYLVVAHDLAVVRQLADRVAVMRAGRIVETGGVDAVFERPQHAYTRELLAAVPVPDPAAARGRRGGGIHLRHTVTRRAEGPLPSTSGGSGPTGRRRRKA